MKRLIAVLIFSAVLITAIALFSAAFCAEEASLLTSDKTAYGLNDPINLTAVGSGQDWVGLYRPGALHSIRWVYVKDIGSGVTFDMRSVGEVNDGEPEDLSAGRYIIRLMPNDSTNIQEALAVIEITIGDVENLPPEENESPLSLDKVTFAYNEPIHLSAIGSGQDWVGLYFPDAAHSIRWVYVEDVGSGVTFDMRSVGEVNDGAPEELSAGKYVIRLMPDDTTDLSRALATVNITILANEEDKPEAPTAVSYDLANKTDGFATGELTVTLAEGTSATDIVCYWANEKGKLEGYTALAKFKVKGSVARCSIGKDVLIPMGATKLWVYAANKDGVLSDAAYVISLPENAASKDFGKFLFEFQVVSDIHLNAASSHKYNINFKNMLTDVAQNSPNSAGIFVSGDIADHGLASEYRQLVQLHASVDGAPPYFLAIGNHDFYNGEYDAKIEQFLTYAKLPNGEHPSGVHYDFWLNGYHFVFLGNDASPVDGVKTTLTSATIKWLDETLAKDRDENRPTFLFLHQSLYNTVAGSLPGQNWNGVVNEAPFRNVLKKYPELIMFNGHSHWILDSESNYYPRSNTLPAIFNTSSVAYLWTSYHKTEGEELAGSEGYYVRVYDDKIVVLGRNFTSGEWVPSAMYALAYEPKTVTPPASAVTTAPPVSETTPVTNQTPVTEKIPNTDAPEQSAEKKNGTSLGMIVGIAAGVVTIGTVSTVLAIKKGKKHKNQKNS